MTDYTGAPEVAGRVPDPLEAKVLSYLKGGGYSGGFTAGGISKGAGLGSTRRMMAVARTSVLLPMVKKGWLAPLDDQKPVIFCATDAGRAALAAMEKQDG